MNEIATLTKKKELTELLTPLSKEVRITKLIMEIALLKSERSNLENRLNIENSNYHDNDNWWKLDARIMACEMILENLTSFCQGCQQEEPEIKLTNGDKYHRECLKNHLENLELYE